MVGWVVLGILILGAVLAVSAYNQLVALRNRYKNAFSQIDVQLKRRYDLIPNLVETAKGYLRHERQTLEAVIAARNQASSAAQRAAAVPGDPAAMRVVSRKPLAQSIGCCFGSDRERTKFAKVAATRWGK